MKKISENKPVSRKRMGVIIVVLIVRIIFILVVSNMYNYGWKRGPSK